MTTFSHTFTVNDSDYSALKAAVEHMIDHCKQKIEEKDHVPYTHHLLCCGRILDSLRNAEHRMTSTNNFWDDDPDAPTMKEEVEKWLISETKRRRSKDK